MQYRIKLICEEVDGFLREYLIDSEATFLDLNNLILASCGYKDDMTTFFLCDDEWERHQQITREDFGEKIYDEDTYAMADARLSELVDEDGQKLEFVFDPFNERSFYLKLQEADEDSDDAPCTIREKGEAPQQFLAIDTDDLIKTITDAKSKAASQEDDDEGYDPYGIGGNTYNTDELDAEGYEFNDGPDY